MAHEDALIKALEDFKALSPFAAAAKAGVDIVDGNFIIPFFNRTFKLSYPEGEIEEADDQQGYPKWLRVLLLHYLAQADGTGPADTWIAYRQLPGANFFEQRFNNMCINPLTEAFGHDLEGFKRGGEALRGHSRSRRHTWPASRRSPLRRHGRR